MMKHIATGVSHTAMLVNLASSSRIGRVPVRLVKPSKEPLAAAKDTL